MWRAVLLAINTGQPTKDILRETWAGIITISLDGSPCPPRPPDDPLAAISTISSNSSMTATQIFEQHKARCGFSDAYAEFRDDMGEFLRNRYSQQMEGIQRAVDDLVAVCSLLGKVNTREESCTQLERELATLDADPAAQCNMAAILGEQQSGGDERAQTTALANTLSTTTTAETKVIKVDLCAQRHTLADSSRRLAIVDIDGMVDDLRQLFAAVTRYLDGN